MFRIIIYELKKLFSLPACVLWAATVVLLTAVMAGRYTNLTGQVSMTAADFRAISMEYAGSLDQDLADRALRDWRTLPQSWSDRDTPEDRARRMVLETLAQEFAAAQAGIAAVELPDGVSADATARLGPRLQASPVPFTHGYWEGWRSVLAAYDGEAAWLCAVMVAFGVSALFSGEGAALMASSVRTTRHGRHGLALAKLTAAGVYALLCAVVCVGIPLVLSAGLFGLHGGQLPAQYVGNTDNPIGYPLTLAQYTGLRVAMAALGALALAGCTALFSSAIPSITTPAVAALGLFAVPMILAQIKINSPVLDCVLRYLPSRLLLAQPVLKSLQAAQLWRDALWQPAWLCLLWAAALPALGMLAARQWLRIRREEPVSQD